MTKSERNSHFPKKPYFLLSGSFLSCNLGTAAMAFSTIDLLRKNFLDCHICVLSTRFLKDSALYPKQHVQRDSRTSFRGLLILCYAVLWRLMCKLFRRDLKCLRRDKEIDVYYKADLLIDLSGDTFTEDYGPLVLFSHCIPLLIAICFSKPVILFGQTIGPFTWSIGLMKWILQSCDCIIARDDLTYKYLQKIDIPPEFLVSSVDMAFLLETTNIKEAKLIETQCGYDPKSCLTLGMTISRQFQDFVERHPDRRNRLGLISTLSEVIDSFIEMYDAQVILFAHVTGPSERLDDRVISRELRDRCRQSERIIVVERELDPFEIKALISRCDLFCGSRMHSNIAATTSGVPTVAMAYSKKSRGIMGRMGMENWVLEIPQLVADRLLECLNDLHAQSASIRGQLQECMPKLREQAMNNIEVIKDILK